MRCSLNLILDPYTNISGCVWPCGSIQCLLGFQGVPNGRTGRSSLSAQVYVADPLTPCRCMLMAQIGSLFLLTAHGGLRILPVFVWGTLETHMDGPGSARLIVRPLDGSRLGFYSSMHLQTMEWTLTSGLTNNCLKLRSVSRNKQTQINRKHISISQEEPHRVRQISFSHPHVGVISWMGFLELVSSEFMDSQEKNKKFSFMNRYISWIGIIWIPFMHRPFQWTTIKPVCAPMCTYMNAWKSKIWGFPDVGLKTLSKPKFSTRSTNTNLQNKRLHNISAQFW